MFPNERGGHLNLTNLRERTWKPALRRAGIRARPLYQSRHTFATLALASGEDIGWVAKMLGHASDEFVQDSCLADPRVPEDGHDVSLAAPSRPQRRPQPRELLVAADERRPR